MKTASRLLTAFLVSAGALLSAQTLVPVETDAKAAPAQAQAPAPATAQVPTPAQATAPAPAKEEVKAATKDEAKPAIDVNQSSDPTVVQAQQKVDAMEKRAAEDAAGAPDKRPNYKSSRLIPYLIITANYKVPAILVQTARRDLKVPYVVIIDDARQPNSETRAVFFPPKASKPVNILAKDLSKLLAYLRVRDVIILGNSDYVPSYYAMAVPSCSRTLMITDPDWKVNAYKLDNILNTNKISQAYRGYINSLEAERKAKREAFEKAEKAKQDAIREAEEKQRAMVSSEEN